MESEYEHGGLKMINMFDIQKVFYLNWIGRLHEAGRENWSAIPKWHIQQLTDFNHLAKINCTQKELKGIEKVQNDFWKEVFLTYLDNKNKVGLEKVDRNDQSINQSINDAYIAHIPWVQF